MHCLEVIKAMNNPKKEEVIEKKDAVEEEKKEEEEEFFGPDQWDADGVDHLYHLTKNGYLKDMGDGTYACICKK